ncbi:hypothetical protein BKA67DRAFT_551382 [Truncatella angustata]|uniref:PLL-like beta propeller domain-containing protein n=1 Tax=Truncatella angustata TaxID=152316 RepID=A0A9P8ZZJ9_9PEZI|nr:uncharacterized protein BKA67DRAFT_551382 [Truncatella angustata]KAH6656253.1 hypothetical protein BKA67DRAFT_551382 [Truncatella angustata]
MAIYDEGTSAVLHRQWSSSQSRWLGWNNRGGSFTGNPVLFSPSADRIDFLGIGMDSAMYHFTWSSTSGYTELKNLGGNWASVPSIVVSGEDRFDAVALGTDGKLKQRALINSTWQVSWHDLGADARSAPLAVSFESTTSIGVFAISKSGELLRGDYRISADSSWEIMSEFRGIGGNLTETWL